MSANDQTPSINELIKSGKRAGTVVPKQISDGHHTIEFYQQQRMILFANLCASTDHINNSWKSKHHFDRADDEAFNDDFLAGLETPLGTVVFHFKNKYWDFFSKIKEIDHGPEYKGSLPEDDIIRLASLLNIDLLASKSSPSRQRTKS